MTQHTPGPWRVKKDQGELQVWRHEPNENPITRIASVCRQLFLIDHGDHVANAKLIAAAPQLLKICQTILKVMEADHAADGSLWWISPGQTGIEALRSVIEDATT